MSEETDLRILLVEDDRADAQIFCRYAADSKLYRIDVDHVTTSEQALDRLSEGQYDLLFLDQRLGEAVTGLDILKRIRAAMPELPAVTLTGTGNEQVAVEMMKSGAMDYLLKDSFNSEILERSIRYSLEQCRQDRARERAEERLRESEARFRTLFEGIPDAVTVHDEKGDILHMNDVAAERLEWPAEELVGRNLREIVTPENAAWIADHVAQASTQGSCSFQTTYVSRTGRHIESEVNERPIQFEGESAILSVARDVTERKALEEQLRRSQKMEAIGGLAGGVAHDFNNLLIVISGYARLILDTLEADSSMRTDVEEIISAGRRAEDLTGQLLAFGRRQMLQTKVLNLNEVVQPLGKMLKRVIGEDIDLVTIVPEDVGNTEADPSQIEQVLMNLAINARDAMPDGGKLIIETASVMLDQQYADRHHDVKPGPYVMLAMTDTGSGMDEEAQEHIFEPFFTTKAEGRGSGLGLSTAYGIVKQHGGHIWVYSEPGEGTVFKIYLPRVDADAKGVPARADAMSTARGTETILLVEDEEAVLRVVRNMLEDQGYRVLTAPSPREAEQLFAKRSGEIDLLLTDVVMPGCSGPSLYERLVGVMPSLKVLYMSGYADNAIVRRRVLEAGASFLQKPFTAEALARKVREVLEQ